MFELGIRISWGECVLCERHLTPPRDFWLGEDDADFSVSEELLGARRLQLVRVDGERISVLDDELAPDERAIHELGEIRIEVWLEPAERTRFGRARDLRIAPFFIGALLLTAGVLVYSALFAPPISEEERQKDQLLLMQRYLLTAAEREVESQAADPSTGTTTFGEPNGAGTSFAVAGPRENDPHIARQAALRDATEFGMVGLISTSEGDHPPPSASGGNPLDEPQQLGDPFGDALAPQGSEEYADHGVNPPVEAEKDPLSTFAVDVDTGSYMIAKRKLTGGDLPPLASVRAEEFINSFDYAYPGPEQTGSKEPFAVHMDAAPSPYDAKHHLLRVAVQGRRVPAGERPPVHLVYLVDTSGSMATPDKIGLAQTSLRLLTSALRTDDTVALCTYAGSVREVLGPTPIARRATILAAIDDLTAEGSTAMASGIDIAYRLAAKTHVRGEISRVVVLSDGDTNVGTRDPDEILEKIRHYRQLGITLSTVGFGEGNYKDARMERLANAGDGNYSYIGSEDDAQQVFVAQAEGLLQVIARDVKLQLEFNPNVVRRYRLIGYENRDVADQDFQNDQIDGGEIGAGHSVTAIYDLELWHEHGSPVTLKLRHKPALEGDRASELAFVMPKERIFKSFSGMDPSFRFAAAVAGFAEILRGSPYALDWKLARVERLAELSQEERPERAELVSLVQRTLELRQVVAMGVPEAQQGVE